jgi:hypothetical protein
VEELGAPIAFPALEEGTPVYDRSMERIRVVEHVLIEGEIFEGLIGHTLPLPGRHQFADADQIADLRKRGVLLSVGRDALHEPSRTSAAKKGGSRNATGESTLQACLRRAWDWISRSADACKSIRCLR